MILKIKIDSKHAIHCKHKIIQQKKSALSNSKSKKKTIANKIKTEIDGQIAFTITATTWLLRTLARLDRRDRHTGHGREFNLSSTAWTQEPADGLPTPLHRIHRLQAPQWWTSAATNDLR